MSPNKDKTGNDRQRRRREREKIWLKEHGFSEWAEVHLAYFGYSSLEALHTALMNDETSLTPRALDAARFCPACHALLEEGSVYCDTCGTDTPRP